MTTIGLPLREDLLIRSLVQVIGSKTIDDWAFHEGFDADVVLCSPGSNLAGVALRRAQQSGTQTCVCVIHDGEDSLPGTTVLHAPIKSTELIALLNEVSHAAGRVRRNPVRTADAPGTRTTADVLHELIQAKSPDLHAVECGAATIFVVPAMRTLYAAAPLDETEVQQWLGARPARADRIDEQSARRILDSAEHRRDLDALLWRIGLEGTDGALLSGLPQDAKFGLKRWPDFGRLTHQAFHFRMAALLSRGAYTIGELASASNHAERDALAFINACAMCDLIRINVAAADPPRAAPLAQRRYSAILNTIRSALGLRA